MPPGIHRLPPELLSKIFEECWTGRESICISHVCSWWRSVLHDTTRFWADAVNNSELARLDYFTGCLDAMLERSAPHMLETSFSFFDANVHQCLAPHAGRVVSLGITSVTSEELSPLWKCLNSGMPRLAALTIILDEFECRWIMKASGKGLSLSPIALPSLTRLSAPVRLFPSLYLPSLQHITLSNTITGESENGRLGSKSFFKTLALCAPHLRTLSLSEATPWVFHTTTPLALPALRHLHVLDVARHCTLLLHHLTLPTTTHIRCTNIDGRGLCLTTAPTAAPIQSVLSTTDRVAIDIPASSYSDPMSVHCYAGDDPEALLHINVETEDVDPPPADRLCSRDVIQFFRDAARVTQLAVRVTVGSRLDLQAVQDVVEWRAFPHLVRAEIHGGGAAYVVLKSLARRLDGESTGASATAVCPKLEVLVVDFIHGAPRRIDRLAEALRDGDIAQVEADLRERCKDLERVLSLRSEMGTRLTRMEFGCTEQGRPDRAGGFRRKSILDPLGSDWTSWQPIVEPLEKLVDGPVVFTGYRYFSADT